MTGGKDEMHKKSAPPYFCSSNISQEQNRSQIEIQLEGVCTQAVII
jgi:hypothetical protein